MEAQYRAGGLPDSPAGRKLTRKNIIMQQKSASAGASGAGGESVRLVPGKIFRSERAMSSSVSSGRARSLLCSNPSAALVADQLWSPPRQAGEQDQNQAIEQERDHQRRGVTESQVLK